MRVLLVHNPRAANGRAAKTLERVRALFSARNVDTDVVLTEAPGHETKIVRSSDFSGYDGVVAGGGDGTLFELPHGALGFHR